jgi:hypothetical protein
MNRVCKHALISGDITDTGEKAQWEQAAKELVHPLRDAGITLIMAPGNHDLQPIFTDSVKASKIQTEAKHGYRFLRMQATTGVALKTVGGASIGSLVTATDDEWKAVLTKINNQCIDGCPVPPLERGALSCMESCMIQKTKEASSRSPQQF